MIFGVFISIGKQVADGLNDSLFVDNGSEVLIGIDDSELFTILLEGGCKTLANRHHQLVDIVRGKVHYQALLFYLAEVEQLVYQLQQAVGIAVDNLQVGRWGTLLHQFLQWSDNERHRGTNLVGYHRKEVQAGLAYLLLFLFIQQL